MGELWVNRINLCFILPIHLKRRNPLYSKIVILWSNNHLLILFLLITGRDRPIKVGHTFKWVILFIQNESNSRPPYRAPDPSIYLCSAESLPNEQLTIMIRKGLGELPVPDVPKHLSVPNDDNSGTDPGISGAKEPVRIKPGRVPYFTDLKRPIFPLTDHFKLGQGWGAIEADFMALKRCRQTREIILGGKVSSWSQNYDYVIYWVFFFFLFIYDMSNYINREKPLAHLLHLKPKTSRLDGRSISMMMTGEWMHMIKILLIKILLIKMRWNKKEVWHVDVSQMSRMMMMVFF